MAATFRVMLAGDSTGSLATALRREGLDVTTPGFDLPEQVNRADVDADIFVMADDAMGSGCLAMLRKIRERHPDLPIILLGRRCQVDLALQALKLGRVDYITRPVSPRRLCDRIEDAVDRRDCLRELLRRTSSRV